MRYRRWVPLLGAVVSAVWLPAVAQQALPEAPAVPAERRVDERRSDQPFTVPLLGRPLQLTGSWEATAEHRDNFDLNDARARNRRVIEHEVKLEARWLLQPDLTAFVQAVGLHDARRTQGTAGTQRSRALERGQTWLRWDRLAGTAASLQLGRVALIDRRSWWWDEDLDAVRATWEQGPWRVDSGVARELSRVSSAETGILPEQRGITRWFGQAGWRWAPRHTLELFWLHARDGSGTPAVGAPANAAALDDPLDLQGRWHGLRASGSVRPEVGAAWQINYWADLAALRGRETETRFAAATAVAAARATASTSRRVKGRAYDIGSTFVWRAAPLRPSFTIGLARGSADFRQTGLQENKARLGGLKRLRYYGELLQPELHNLRVSTLGAGLRFLQNSSVELLWHGYRQPTPSALLSGSKLSQAPAGLDGRLGREIDLLIALREWQHVEFTLRLSRFQPGTAFAPDRRDVAHGVEFGAALNF